VAVEAAVDEFIEYPAISFCARTGMTRERIPARNKII
jgi:hypothetical protein